MAGAKKFNVLLLLFFILYFIIVITKSCLHNNKTLRRYDNLQKQYEKELELNKELKLKLDQLNKDDFIELTARKKLGLAKPGEIVYKIVEE